MKLIRLNTAPHDNGPPSVAPQTVNEPPRPFCKVPISLNTVAILSLYTRQMAVIRERTCRYETFDRRPHASVQNFDLVNL